MLAGRTDPAAGDAAEKLLLLDADADCDERISGFRNRGEVTIKPFCLSQGSRITIQDIASPDIGLSESRSHHIVHHLVRNKLALVHKTFGGLAEIGPAPDITAKDIASGDLWNTEVRHQALGLGSLSDARRSQKKDRPGQES